MPDFEIRPVRVTTPIMDAWNAARQIAYARQYQVVPGAIEVIHQALNEQPEEPDRVDMAAQQAELIRAPERPNRVSLPPAQGLPPQPNWQTSWVNYNRPDFIKQLENIFNRITAGLGEYIPPAPPQEQPEEQPAIRAGYGTVIRDTFGRPIFDNTPPRSLPQWIPDDNSTPNPQQTKEEKMATLLEQRKQREEYNTTNNKLLSAMRDMYYQLSPTYEQMIKIFNAMQNSIATPSDYLTAQTRFIRYYESTGKAVIDSCEKKYNAVCQQAKEFFSTAEDEYGTWIHSQFDGSMEEKKRKAKTWLSRQYKRVLEHGNLFPKMKKVVTIAMGFTDLTKRTEEVIQGLQDKKVAEFADVVWDRLSHTANSLEYKEYVDKVVGTRSRFLPHYTYFHALPKLFNGNPPESYEDEIAARKEFYGRFIQYLRKEFGNACAIVIRVHTGEIEVIRKDHPDQEFRPNHTNVVVVDGPIDGVWKVKD